LTNTTFNLSVPATASKMISEPENTILSLKIGGSIPPVFKKVWDLIIKVSN